MVVDKDKRTIRKVLRTHIERRKITLLNYEKVMKYGDNV